MDKIVALAKRRGFIYPSSEIYGGIAGFWDYGPMGVELKKNIKKEWWKNMVYQRDNVVGIDASIVMNPEVWVKSGHVGAFTDPLVECKNCHHRFRADKIVDFTCPDCQSKNKLTAPRQFNLLTEVYLGTTEPKQKAYLRGEITQGVFVNFQNIISSTRVKIPFGIAQIGKAFRNEVTPGNFTYRSREFEQMELEYFIKPDEKEGKRVFDEWKNERLKWYISLGMKPSQLRFREHNKDEIAHYARFATDIEYQAPFGWSEFEGVHHRGDWDLKQHNLKYKDPETGDEYIPWVIETSGGVDRAALFFLIEAYKEVGNRIILQLNPKLSPVKVAVFPLVANKDDLVKKAKKVYSELKKGFVTAWDDRGNIGKRYFAQDEIGTPFCVTIDYQTIEDETVTVRDRDTMKQERINTNKLNEYLNKKLEI
jgi:glycyl-tRNA synthetase